MPNRIVHYGLDECGVIPTLASAGYRVEECGSVLSVFSDAIQDADLDAIAISEAAAVRRDSVVQVARISSSAPLVLFQGRFQQQLDPAEFDLAIRWETQPEQWLATVNALVESSRALREVSRNLRRSVTSLHAELVKAGESLREEINRSQSNHARILIKFEDGQEWFNSSWVVYRLRTLIRPMFRDPEVDACLERGEEVGLLDFTKLDPKVAARMVIALRAAAENVLSSPADTWKVSDVDNSYRLALSDLLGIVNNVIPIDRRVAQPDVTQFPIPRRRKSDRSRG